MDGKLPWKSCSWRSPQKCKRKGKAGKGGLFRWYARAWSSSTIKDSLEAGGFSTSRGEVIPKILFPRREFVQDRGGAAIFSGFTRLCKQIVRGSLRRGGTTAVGARGGSGWRLKCRSMSNKSTSEGGNYSSCSSAYRARIHANTPECLQDWCLLN